MPPKPQLFEDYIRLFVVKANRNTKFRWLDTLLRLNVVDTRVYQVIEPSSCYFEWKICCDRYRIVGWGL